MTEVARCMVITGFIWLVIAYGTILIAIEWNKDDE